MPGLGLGYSETAPSSSSSSSRPDYTSAEIRVVSCHVANTLHYQSPCPAPHSTDRQIYLYLSLVHLIIYICIYGTPRDIKKLEMYTVVSSPSVQSVPCPQPDTSNHSTLLCPASVQTSRNIKSQKRKFVLFNDSPPSLQIMIVIDVQLGYYIWNQG